MGCYSQLFSLFIDSPEDHASLNISAFNRTRAASVSLSVP